MKTQTLAKLISVFAIVSLCGLAACDKDKGEPGSSGSGDKKEAKFKKLEMVPTKISALGVSMKAPKGAKIEGDKNVTIRKGNQFGVEISKDIYGAKGDTLIIPFEKKRMTKKLVDKPTLQIWEKEMGGETVVLFAMTAKVGDKKFYIKSLGTGMYDRKQVDRMVEAVHTLKAQ
jgi:hypothetical protein